MAAERKQWSDLSPGMRRLIIWGGIGEGLLKVAALNDIRQRPPDQVRGPKWLWVTVLALVGSGGILPISYFLIGRRQSPAA